MNDFMFMQKLESVKNLLSKYCSILLTQLPFFFYQREQVHISFLHNDIDVVKSSIITLILL